MQEAAPHLLPANSSLPSRGSWLPRLGTLSTPTDEPMRLGQAGGGAGLGGGQARLQQTPGTQSPPIGLQQLSPINIDGPELLVKASPLTWGGGGTGPGAARRGPRGWVIGVPEPPGCPALTCTSPGGAQRSPGGPSRPQPSTLTHRTGPWHSSWRHCQTGPGCRCGEGLVRVGPLHPFPGLLVVGGGDSLGSAWAAAHRPRLAHGALRGQRWRRVSAWPWAEGERADTTWQRPHWISPCPPPDPGWSPDRLSRTQMPRPPPPPCPSSRHRGPLPRRPWVRHRDPRTGQQSLPLPGAVWGGCEKAVLGARRGPGRKLL